MNVTDDDFCGSAFVGRLDHGWIVYHVVFDAVYIFANVSTALTWLWLFFSGRRTDFEPSIMVSAAIAALPYAVYKLLFILNKPSVMIDCHVQRFAALMAFTLFFPFLGVHLVLHNRIKYNKAMVKYFDKVRSQRSSSKLESVSGLAELNALRAKSLSSYLRKFFLVLYPLYWILCAAVTPLLCSLDCQVFTDTWNRPYFLGLLVTLIFLMSHLCLMKQFSHLIDSKNHLYTTLLLTKFCVFPAIFVNILNLMDESVFHYFEEDKVGFNLNLGLDYILLGYSLILGLSPILRKRDILSKDSISLTIRDVLTNPNMVPLFQEFLQATVCVENLIFWKAVEWYKRNETKRERNANYVYNHFIQVAAEAQVNLSHDSRELVRERINNGDFAVDLFDEVQGDIEHLMQFDLLPRFIGSPYYKTLLGDEVVSDSISFDML